MNNNTFKVLFSLPEVAQKEDGVENAIVFLPDPANNEIIIPQVILKQLIETYAWAYGYTYDEYLDAQLCDYVEQETDMATYDFYKDEHSLREIMAYESFKNMTEEQKLQYKTYFEEQKLLGANIEYLSTLSGAWQELPYALPIKLDIVYRIKERN